MHRLPVHRCEPVHAPWGERIKALGNDPWSWAAPAGRYAPLVLDIARLQPLAEFEVRMERLIAGMKAVFYPGEIEVRADAENRRDGPHRPTIPAPTCTGRQRPRAPILRRSRPRADAEQMCPTVIPSRV